MSTPGCDYASPDISAAALVEHQLEFACRYASTPGNPKNLTAGEARALIDAGRGVVSVFETTADRALAGAAAGAADIVSARAQHAEFGLTEDRPVYLTVDFNMTQAQWPAVRAYFTGARTTPGAGKIGVYGGVDVCRALLGAGLVDYVWQTWAWSAGQWADLTHIRQIPGTVTIDGFPIDLDVAFGVDYGQWPFSSTEDQVDLIMPAATGRHIAIGCAGQKTLRILCGWGQTVEVEQLIFIGDSSDGTTANYLENAVPPNGQPDLVHTVHSDCPGVWPVPAGAVQASITYGAAADFSVSLSGS